MSSSKSTAFLIVNFGGPRSLQEIEPFLKSLLTDKDVVRTNLPNLINDILFKRIAKKRSRKIAADYEKIGGKSPIYDDTEAVASALREKIDAPILTFHRYIPATHTDFIRQIEELDVDEIRVFPMFPQFTYATTGSVARWFENNLFQSTVNKMRWIKSYPAHPSYIKATQNQIQRFLDANQLDANNSYLFFSAHGIPKKFMETGDLYRDECEASFRRVMEAFPEYKGLLAYQSKFGPGEWLRPYTIDLSESVNEWNEGKENIVFIPISFTSDHIETLFEIEEEYLPVIREAGFNAYRVPALTMDSEWIEAIQQIMQESNVCGNQMLVRKL